MWRRAIVLLLFGGVLATQIAFIPANADYEPCGPWCREYDLVVVGSEIEGVLLAKAAKDEGLDVLILDPREAAGGQLIQGQMIVLDEPRDKNRKSLVQGEIKKLYDGYNRKEIRDEEEFRRYFDRVIRNIPIRNGIDIRSIEAREVEGNHVVESLSYVARDGYTYKVKADYWVENTDFNALARFLDVHRIPGVETVYKSAAPDYMAATMMLKFKKVNWSKLHAEVLKDYPLSNVETKYGPNTYVDWNFATGFSNVTANYVPQDSQLMLRGINATDQLDGEVVMNALLIFDVDPADPESVQRAMDKARKEAPLILDFMRQNIPGFSNAELNGFPDYLYIRDYNRFETAYVLNFTDVMKGTMFWDNVSIGGYPVDLQGTRNVPSGINLGKPDRYGIPLRSFLLKSYDNVLVAGKNVGATAQAYGSVRIMPNTALAGETIGIILGRESGTKKLRELDARDFERIHRYLSIEYDIRLRK